MYSCDSCQLKRHVSSQFASSLFPLHLRHLSNCSYQMHLQIEKLIMAVPFRMYYLHDLCLLAIDEHASVACCSKYLPKYL